MNTTPLAAALASHPGQSHRQSIFPFLDVVNPAIEKEQKYLHPGDPNEQYHLQSAFVGQVLADRNFEVVDFSGIDYGYLIDVDGRVFDYRFRTGDPSNWLLCVKYSEGKGDDQARHEVEFPLDPTVTLPTVMQFLDTIVLCSGGKSKKVEKHVNGVIRYVPYGEIVAGKPQEKIEVVVYTGLNKANGNHYCVAEIEAHNFTDRDRATAAILEYEALLGWQSLRIRKSLSQLLTE